MKNIEINTKAVKKLFAAGLLAFTMAGCAGNNEPTKGEISQGEKTEENDMKITQEEADAMAESFYGFENVKVIDYGTSKDEYKNGQEIKKVLDAVELEGKGYAVEYHGTMTITTADGEVTESPYFDYVEPQVDGEEHTYPNGSKSISNFDYTKVYKIIGIAESDHGLVKVIEVDGSLKSCGDVLTDELSNMYSSKKLTK